MAKEKSQSNPAELNRQEQDVLDSLVRGTLALAPVTAKHSTWLLAAGAGAAALLGGHLEDLQKLDGPAQFGLGLSGFSLALAIVVGLFAKLYSLRPDLRAAAQALEDDARALGEHLSRDEEAERPAVDIGRALQAFGARSPRRVRSHIRRLLAQTRDPIELSRLVAGESLEAFYRQHRLLRLQYFFTIFAAGAAFLVVYLEYLGAGTHH